MANSEIVNLPAKSYTPSSQMLRKTKAYLFITIVAAFITVGSFAVYTVIKRMFPTGILKTVVTGLELRELDKSMLVNEYSNKKAGIDVLNYDINIELVPEEKKIIGDVIIRLKVNRSVTTEIPLHFYRNLSIYSITVNDEPAEYGRKEKLITVENKFPELDTINVRIQYSGKPESLGLGSFNFEKHNDHNFIYTLNEPVFASTWLPCVDIPNDKAFMDMKIVNDSCCVSLSNGKLISVTPLGNKNKYHWKTFYPISTYLIAIYSGQYKTLSNRYRTINDEILELNYYAFPEDVEDFANDCEDHPVYLKVFEELFGPYPFAKEKYSVAEFLWQLGAMEHQTLTGIGSNMVSGRKFFKDILIHELAHHWWGNAVGPKTWKDIWLNEGFATYSEALYWEKAAGYRALQSTLASKRNSFKDGILYEPENSLFSRLVYDKGAWVLHMLRREVGDKNFFQILRTYFNNYKYGNASTYDFMYLCERIASKKLKYFFDQWVFKGEGRIELEYEWTAEKMESGYLVKLDISQIQSEYELYQFPIDIKIIYGENELETKIEYVQKIDEEFRFTCAKLPDKIILDPDSWLLASIESKNEK